MNAQFSYTVMSARDLGFNVQQLELKNRIYQEWKQIWRAVFAKVGQECRGTLEMSGFCQIEMSSAVFLGLRGCGGEGAFLRGHFL